MFYNIWIRNKQVYENRRNVLAKDTMHIKFEFFNYIKFAVLLCYVFQSVYKMFACFYFFIYTVIM